MANIQALHLRVTEASGALTDPNISEAKLEHYYTELREISVALRAKDAEARTQVITFSNGLKLAHSEIARRCAETSIADFCILTGLTRAEVLERTGLNKAGVS